MILEFIPRAELWQRIAQGWVPAPGWDYNTSAYAFLMKAPSQVEAPITIGKPKGRRSSRNAKRLQREGA